MIVIPLIGLNLMVSSGVGGPGIQSSDNALMKYVSM